MTAENFAYWLQGYLEVSGTKELNKEQLKIVQDHLKLVLTKVTPTYSSGTLQIQQGSSYTGYPTIGSLATC